jgi:hypothetical protein
MPQLLTRTNAGITVDVGYEAVSGTLTLAVGVAKPEEGILVETAEIAPERVLDAFHHPFVYLNEEQTHRLLGERPCGRTSVNPKEEPCSRSPT